MRAWTRRWHASRIEWNASLRMPMFSLLQLGRPGFESPFTGGSALALAFVVLSMSGCDGNVNTRTLPPAQVAMTKDVAPIYDDGELTLYEVKGPLAFPIV